jgi:glycerol uptake facilitator-like aquaporin
LGDNKLEFATAPGGRIPCGLLVAVVGSAIMGERLADGNTAIALMANSLATAALVAQILCVEEISGAHFNPVTCSAALQKSFP